MINEDQKITYINSFSQWLGTHTSLTIKYLAIKHEGGLILVSANISASIYSQPNNYPFLLETEDIVAGCFEQWATEKSKILKIIEDAVNGKLDVSGYKFSIGNEERISHYSESMSREKENPNIHLQISGETKTYHKINHDLIDNQLRLSEIPFDGLDDLKSFLNLQISQINHFESRITIRVHPPIELLEKRCQLSNNEVIATIQVAKDFHKNDISLSIRSYPGDGIKSRMQVASKIEWEDIDPYTLEGTAKVLIKNADEASIILMAGTGLVRRIKVVDRAKARNSRLMSVMRFDKDLEKLHRGLFNPAQKREKDREFEKSVSLFFFLLGFSPALQMESDSPDIIMTTANGTTVLVECTVETRDFATKLGKLVDRCGAISRTLESGGHISKVYGILISRQYRDQIASADNDSKLNRIHLMTREDIESKLGGMENHFDPDEMLSQIDEEIRQKKIYDPINHHNYLF